MYWLGAHQDSESPVQPGGMQEGRSVLLDLVSGRDLVNPEHEDAKMHNRNFENWCLFRVSWKDIQLLRIDDLISEPECECPLGRSFSILGPVSL